MLRTRAVQAGGGEPDSRERIPEAAMSTLAEQAFDGATTRDIAAGAGVSPGLLRYCFDGKLKLWRAAVDRASEELRPTVADTPGDTTLIDGTEPTRRLIEQYARFFAAHAEAVARVMLGPPIEEPPA